MVEQFDSMGVRDHFPICRNFCVGIFFGIFLLDFFVFLYFGIFVWDFLWWGGVYMVPLAYDNGMVPHYGEWESWH